MPGFFGPGSFDSNGSEGNPFDDFMAQFFGAQGSDGNGPRPRKIDLGQVLDAQMHEVLTVAARDARQLGQPEIHALHLLRALAETDAVVSLLRRVGADREKLSAAAKQELEKVGGVQAPSPSSGAVGSAALSVSAQRTLINAHRVAEASGAQLIAPEHVFIALVMDRDTAAGRLLSDAGMTPQALQAAATDDEESEEKKTSETPTLDKYGHDLTARARSGGVDPVIGRADEIEQTIEILSRRTKNNPVLVGEAGVGKTAIVEGLAQRIVDEDVPDSLLGKRIVQLDLSGMLAGTRYRGDFEERMNKVIDEVSAHSTELVIFIDELHTMVGAGGAEGAVDAGNMLKPRLARGELHIVGATTLDEYRSHIEKDSALERRFQPVTVDEPNRDDAVAILTGLRERYEEHHKVHFTDEALAAAVELSTRYVPDRQLPDKAIDLIDQAGARKRLRPQNGDTQALAKRLDQLTEEKDQAVASEDYERASQVRDQIAKLQERAGSLTDDQVYPEVDTEDIAEIVSRATGIPVSQLTQQEKDRLRQLEEELHHRVIGQDDAVRAIARAVRRNRTGMGDPNRPVGSFLFLGPTGVGKTELAKSLAGALFGDENRMIRLDMSEFGERHTVSRLVGAPPGYVGYGESGQLTEQVRRHPYSVVLLDEIEKAHHDVFNTLLQVLDDGRLTDGQGRTVDFRNTVLIMTSNVGSDIISSRSGGLGFATSEETRTETDLRSRLMGRLRDSMRPEFLNRIDEIVVFGKLEMDQLHRIADLLLDDSRGRLGEMDISIDFTSDAVDWIAERGHQPEFGARPLRRAIQREVDDRIADLLLADRLAEGGRVVVDVANDDLDLQVV